MLRPIALFTLLMVSGLSQAAQPWEGVWRGQIGSYPITACLQADEYNSRGLYYYQKHLTPIGLSLSDKAPKAISQWEENGSAAKWENVSVGKDGVLQGTWRDKGKSLSIKLNPVPSTGDADQACLSNEFHRALETPAKIKSKVEQFDGQNYLEAWLDTSDEDNRISRIVVAATASEQPKLNAEVVRALKADQQEQFECLRSALVYSGYAGNLSQQSKLSLLTAHWYVIETNSNEFCGGAHPNYGTNYQTFQRGKAEEINVWQWFNSTAVTFDGQFAKPNKPLRQLLVQAWEKNADDECKNIGTDEDVWNVSPSKTGLMFMPFVSHAMFVCSDQVEITYSKLEKLLSPQGKAAIASIKADLKQRQ
ncbi:hypothetical protein HZU75_07315 [Chitinibacter fontanus]|uniref:DUF3298 domain-containing protein n=1 Tax=Chitinibacter fontanus TaxID=1737446 RepID=A0A7D5ZG81_9NEIS|nr:hypothetical protein [Chitinibacter fontanus]QLI81349.1 hypothetical protein HZU75_07315 [Chitinibacter fontanus]